MTNTLVRMGAESILLQDFDTVKEENVAPSFFSTRDVKAPKTHAVRDRIYSDFGFYINISEEAYSRQIRDVDIVIITVDSLNMRRTIWNNHRITYRLWIDARMGFDQVGVYSHLFGAPVDTYELTLSRPGEPLPCGQKATAPLSIGLVPGLVGTVVMRYLRELPIPSEIFAKVLMDDMFVSFGKTLEVNQ